MGTFHSPKPIKLEDGSRAEVVSTSETGIIDTIPSTSITQVQSMSISSEPTLATNTIISLPIKKTVNSVPTNSTHTNRYSENYGDKPFFPNKRHIKRVTSPLLGITGLTRSPQTILQQQIQAQLHAQLQAQLKAAAVRCHNPNFTTKQIQAQAQAMVQAAAQAQAVVEAAKSRGDGLVPMSVQQIHALSDIQAQAIVNARPHTSLIGVVDSQINESGEPTSLQIRNQIQLQSQALVHAHTQAQISAGIFKGDEKFTNIPPTLSSNSIRITNKKTNGSCINTCYSSTVVNPIDSPDTKITVDLTNELSSHHPEFSTQERVRSHKSFNIKQDLIPIMSKYNVIVDDIDVPTTLLNTSPSVKSVENIGNIKENACLSHPSILKLNSTMTNMGVSPKSLSTIATTSMGSNTSSMPIHVSQMPTPISDAVAAAAVLGDFHNHPTKSPSVKQDNHGSITFASQLFINKLSTALKDFWSHQFDQIRNIGSSTRETEHDFKNHNDLPLARIKRIMKSDEDVRMISAETPVLFAKACEMFILELTLRSWSYSESNKRKTLQRDDICEAIVRTDVFDFLAQVIL